MVKSLAGIRIGIIGGDARDLVLIKELVKQGADVKVVGFPLRPELEGAKIVENVLQAVKVVDVVILPMSGTDDYGNVKSVLNGSKLTINEEAMSCLRPGTLLLVGVAKPILKDLATKYKLKLIETAELDEIAILNSIPTAEGAIQIAMEKLPITIHGSKALVLGMGRCGSTLASFLQALGAQVYVTARKPSDLARGRVQGFQTLTYSELNKYLGQFDVIFNTVPALILDSSRLALVNSDCLIIDLASSPGGTDFLAAEKLGIRAMLAPGLPGKVAPYTAGRIIADNYPGIILREMNEFPGGAIMMLAGKKIGFAMTGSHCTLEKLLPEVQNLVAKGADVWPILSESVQSTNTRFGLASRWSEELRRITGKEPITSIVEAEPIGPKGYFDVLVIAPCTGNTLSKLAQGITDGTVLMAAKAHLRNQKPLVLGISTNDGLGNNAKNLSILLNTKNIYFVPFGQDDPFNKPNSLVAYFPKIEATLLAALDGKQIQPLLYSYH